MRDLENLKEIDAATYKDFEEQQAKAREAGMDQRSEEEFQRVLISLGWERVKELVDAEAPK
jgi:hypothetical protein